MASQHVIKIVSICVVVALGLWCIRSASSPPASVVPTSAKKQASVQETDDVILVKDDFPVKYDAFVPKESDRRQA